jgi:hypothetical protein
MGPTDPTRKDVAIKGTTFVYQGKRGFSYHNGIIKAKRGENQAKSGFGAVDWLLRRPIFCFQTSKIAQNAGVHFGSFYAASNPKKCSDHWARTKPFRKNNTVK